MHIEPGFCVIEAITYRTTGTEWRRREEGKKDIQQKKFRMQRGIENSSMRRDRLSTNPEPKEADPKKNR